MAFTVAYATDNNYVQHVAVSLFSLFSNSCKDEKILVFILGNKLSRDNAEKLQQVAKDFGHDVNIVDISDIEELLPVGVDVANLSISTYCRLFLAELLPASVNEVLYLDCDTLVGDNITEISDYVKSDDWYIAGVEDTMYPYMKRGIRLGAKDLYINAGVLYINLKRWRSDNVIKLFIEFIKSFNGSVPHLDQGVINGVFQTGKIKLPLRYNVQSPIYAIHRYSDLIDYFSLSSFYSPKEVKEAKLKPCIIHFTSFFVERPWFSFCLHPFRSQYRRFLKNTPFANIPLKTNGISMTSKIKDLAFKYFQPFYLILKRR